MQSFEPLVSVHIITYNHEQYIEQAIDSVLAQKTNFKYEIVIGDDFSQDGTRDIIKQYHEKHPDMIRPFLHAQNLGPVGLEGKNNFFSTLAACKGKYVAILDGDDYWIDECKLQKQVDVLESNPDVSICGHSTNYLYDDDRMVLSHLNVGIATRKNISETGDSIPCHICSVVFRNVYKLFPDWIYKTRIGDWPLISLLLTKGDLMLLPDVMSVYRQNSGLWSSRPRLHQVTGIIETLNYMLGSKDFKGFHQFKRNLTQTKVQYLKELHAAEEADKYSTDENEISVISYYEDIVSDHRDAFKSGRELAARAPLGALIKAVFAKFNRRLVK